MQENNGSLGKQSIDHRSAPDGGNAGQVLQGGGKIPKGIWIQFPDTESYAAREKELFETIADSDGNDDVVIFIKNPKGYKVLPPNRRVSADRVLTQKLMAAFGQENVKIRS